MVQTIAELFYEGLKFDLPDALAAKSQGAFRPLSHPEVQERVERLALALRARGLAKGDRIGFLCENRPEWAMADFACAALGVVSVPVYHTLTPDQIADILHHSGARWVLTSGGALLNKIKACAERLPELEKVVVLDDLPGDPGPLDCLSWDALLAEGAALDSCRGEIQAEARSRVPDDLLTIIYTSGTTGDPKGAMLSQGNVASDLEATVEVAIVALRPERGDRCLSVLPLSHIFERTGGYYAMWYLGIAIYYAESLISLPQNLLEVRPAVLMAVPRIFEKIYTKVRDALTSGGLVKRLVFGWARATCHRVVRYLYFDRHPKGLTNLALQVADRILLSKIREKTGGRLRFCVSGGAGIDPTIMEFFWAMGVPIYEGYGLTETSPILTLNRLGKVRPGFVGHPILKTWNGRPFLKLAADGEILCQGPNVMKGYWNNEVATREAFDAEGYFLTGDLGELDPQGRVKITDRKKEIIVTNGGKNVAPQPIENALREDPYIEQAIVVGDRRNHLAALIVPYFPALRDWCQRKQLPVASDAEILANPKVLAKVMSRVNHTNARLPTYERIRKIALLDRELTPESGLVTPSLKLKRRVVNEAFKDLIDGLYRGNA